MKPTRLALIVMILATLPGPACQRAPKEVERPERILSKSQVMYDSSTYAKLAQLWEKYYDAYPSEDAYANWMYAAFYADLGDVRSMIEKGVEKYPANPVLLYLSARSKNWGHDNLQARQLLEKAAALDPDYMDAWHALVAEYIVQGDREKADVALRRLLNGRAIEDVVTDFSYNMIASLDTNAILITNGDNDTFPGWILTRIIRFRPDVNIVNRALLNVDSYASSLVKEGVPEFITQDGLDSLKTQVAADKEKFKSGQLTLKEFTVLGDRLVVRIINAGERVGRPVYFSCTLEPNDLLKHFATQGTKLGLVTLVTHTTLSYTVRIRKLFATWITGFRTGGLESWQTRFSKEADAGRILSRNYAAGLHSLKDQIQASGPEVQLSLFRWYRKYLVDVLPRELVDEVNRMWCGPGSPREIQEWCETQGLAR